MNRALEFLAVITLVLVLSVNGCDTGNEEETESDDSDIPEICVNGDENDFFFSDDDGNSSSNDNDTNERSFDGCSYTDDDTCYWYGADGSVKSCIIQDHDESVSGVEEEEE